MLMIYIVTSREERQQMVDTVVVESEQLGLSYSNWKTRSNGGIKEQFSSKCAIRDKGINLQ